MAILSEEAKIFIMKQLARFKTPQQIATLVHEHFNITPTRQQVWNFNPDFGRATVEQVAIYKAERLKFFKELDSIPGYHPGYRLNVLQEELDHERAKPRTKRRTNVVLSILRQMAQEEGGMFTKPKLMPMSTGRDEGKPVGKGDYFSLVETAFIYRNSLMTELDWPLEKANAMAMKHYYVTEDELGMFDIQRDGEDTEQ